MKRSKLKNKVWLYLFIFAFVIILGIWFLQILSLDIYYELSKKSEIKNIATQISKKYTSGDYQNELNKISFEKDVCIEITENSNISYSTDSTSRGCLINSREINEYKLEFMLSGEKSITYKIIHPNFKNKVTTANHKRLSPFIILFYRHTAIINMNDSMEIIQT